MDAHEHQGDAAETPAPAPAVPPQPKPGIPPGTPDWWGHADAPWDRSTIQLWVDEVDSVRWEPNGDVFWKALQCPRCTHQITFDVGGGDLEEFDVDPEAGELAATGERTPGWCNCDTDQDAHPGRPAERKRGCGQNGWIERP